MKRVKLIATAAALALLAVLASQVAAQETNTSERTFLTFSNSVEMPGVTLQPGTYVFKLADTPSRNVVQVWDRDEKNMVGHWLFVQAERPEVSGENVVMFKETREGSTPAVQYWYFPGERIGKEFLYPKDQAERIASRTGAKVRTETGVVEGAGLAGIQAESPAVSAEITPEAPAVTAEVTKEAPQPAQPTAAAGSLAGNRGVQTEQPAEADLDAKVELNVADNSAAVSADTSPRPVGTSGSAEGQVARNDAELPRTASPLALNGLLGLLSLAGAAGLRIARK
jgi:hypothetical protein